MLCICMANAMLGYLFGLQFYNLLYLSFRLPVPVVCVNAVPMEG